MPIPDELVSADAADARRYRYLRNRPVGTIERGGVFAGLTWPPRGGNVLNGNDLDVAIDQAMQQEETNLCATCGQPATRAKKQCNRDWTYYKNEEGTRCLWCGCGAACHFHQPGVRASVERSLQRKS